MSKKILTFGSSAFPSNTNCVYQSSLDGKESVSSLVLFCSLMIRDCWNATSAFSLEALSSRASQFFQIAKQIEGDVVEVIWVGCSQILFVQAYFWCFNLQYCSMQWKSLNSSNYFSTFQNRALPLGHTAKTTKQHLFAIKKESNFHKIRKS